MDEGAVCDDLLAKLDELMEFLQFARIRTADFHGVVTFMFRATQGRQVACVRTVDLRNGVVVSKSPLSAANSFAPEAAMVYVSLADFLYMYSGEATAAEIAGMVMSGRVSVAWSAYGKLKAFAECFNFSVEKWDEFYVLQESRGRGGRGATSRTQCTRACCQATTKEEIDANWILISDATVMSDSGDWEVVSDCKCHVIPRENRAKMEEVFGVPQINDWLSMLCGGHINKTHVQSVQTNVRNSLHDLKTMANKLFVSLEAT
ncbi:TPA: hypothetical protein N0F65_003178 [Lagenidium giganteum]|uniref:Uncharacterized protein n=1 Tax=Lagenidium giganteum TaxID=4803 RepID=A0AAV2ZEM0_9STRA|nr:TPA: hypothetical protein N0F65_003178 [Lagenidium giganteum]